MSQKQYGPGFNFKKNQNFQDKYNAADEAKLKKAKAVYALRMIQVLKMYDWPNSKPDIVHFIKYYSTEEYLTDGSSKDGVDNDDKEKTTDLMMILPELRQQRKKITDMRERSSKWLGSPFYYKISIEGSGRDDTHLWVNLSAPFLKERCSINWIQSKQDFEFAFKQLDDYIADCNSEEELQNDPLITQLQKQLDKIQPKQKNQEEEKKE